MNLRDDLKIDVQNLDVEWATLPELHHLYNAEAISLEKRIKMKKLKLATYSAKLSRNIRLNKEQYLEGDEKITIKLVQDLIDTDDEFIEKTTRIIEMETKRKLIMATVDDLDVKRTSLSNLTKLFMSEFYSVPTNEGGMAKYDNAYAQIEDTTVMKKVLKKLTKNHKEKLEKNNG